MEWASIKFGRLILRETSFRPTGVIRARHLDTKVWQATTCSRAAAFSWQPPPVGWNFASVCRYSLLISKLCLKQRPPLPTPHRLPARSNSPCRRLGTQPPADGGSDNGGETSSAANLAVSIMHMFLFTSIFGMLQVSLLV